MSGTKQPPSSLPANFRTFENEYRELYETYLLAATYLDGDKMPRELKQRVNAALNKAAVRFNAQALAETQKPR